MLSRRMPHEELLLPRTSRSTQERTSRTGNIHVFRGRGRRLSSHSVKKEYSCSTRNILEVRAGEVVTGTRRTSSSTGAGGPASCIIDPDLLAQIAYFEGKGVGSTPPRVRTPGSSGFARSTPPRVRTPGSSASGAEEPGVGFFGVCGTLASEVGNQVRFLEWGGGEEQVRAAEPSEEESCGREGRRNCSGGGCPGGAAHAGAVPSSADVNQVWMRSLFPDRLNREEEGDLIHTDGGRRNIIASEDNGGRTTAGGGRLEHHSVGGHHFGGTKNGGRNIIAPEDNIIAPVLEVGVNNEEQRRGGPRQHDAVQLEGKKTGFFNNDVLVRTVSAGVQVGGDYDPVTNFRPLGGNSSNGVQVGGDYDPVTNLSGPSGELRCPSPSGAGNSSNVPFPETATSNSRTEQDHSSSSRGTVPTTTTMGTAPLLMGPRGHDIKVPAGDAFQPPTRSAEKQHNEDPRPTTARVGSSNDLTTAHGDKAREFRQRTLSPSPTERRLSELTRELVSIVRQREGLTSPKSSPGVSPTIPGIRTNSGRKPQQLVVTLPCLKQTFPEGGGLRRRVDGGGDADAVATAEGGAPPGGQLGGAGPPRCPGGVGQDVLQGGCYDSSGTRVGGGFSSLSAGVVTPTTQANVSKTARELSELLNPKDPDRLNVLVQQPGRFREFVQGAFSEAQIASMSARIGHAISLVGGEKLPAQSDGSSPPADKNPCSIAVHRRARGSCPATNSSGIVPDAPASGAAGEVLLKEVKEKTMAREINVVKVNNQRRFPARSPLSAEQQDQLTSGWLTELSTNNVPRNDKPDADAEDKSEGDSRSMVNILPGFLFSPSKAEGHLEQHEQRKARLDTQLTDLRRSRQKAEEELSQIELDTTEIAYLKTSFGSPVYKASRKERTGLDSDDEKTADAAVMAEQKQTRERERGAMATEDGCVTKKIDDLLDVLFAGGGHAGHAGRGRDDEVSVVGAGLGGGISGGISTTPEQIHDKKNYRAKKTFFELSPPPFPETVHDPLGCSNPAQAAAPSSPGTHESSALFSRVLRDAASSIHASPGVWSSPGKPSPRALFTNSEGGSFSGEAAVGSRLSTTARLGKNTRKLLLQREFGAGGFSGGGLADIGAVSEARRR